MLPMIDVVEVGAGGGSIAWADDVGALKVGPQSAGADPGPICYGAGGTEPTITDANVVLGRLNPRAFVGGEMQPDDKGVARGARGLGGEGLRSPLFRPRRLGRRRAAPRHGDRPRAARAHGYRAALPL